jgi:hypothetical protein
MRLLRAIGTKSAAWDVTHDDAEPWVRRDARGYSWPPFAEGNDANLIHGLFATQKREPRELAYAAPSRLRWRTSRP